jgi:hypothetical protein
MTQIPKGPELRLRCGLGKNQLLESVFVVGEIGFAGGELIEAQDVCEQVGGVWAAERAGCGGGHQLLNHVVQIDRRLTFVFGEEFISGQRWIRAYAVQSLAMT